MLETATMPFAALLSALEEIPEAVDKWRAQQPGLPGRAAAIRMLVEMALAKPGK